MKQILLLIVLLSLTLPQTSFAQSEEDAANLLNRINALRLSIGLSPYTSNEILTAVAQQHAEWMAQTGQVEHAQPDGSTPSSRAVAAGYPSSFVSENIYLGMNAERAWEWWMNSPTHIRGITHTDITEIGIGVATGARGTAYVLVFGNPQPEAMPWPPIVTMTEPEILMMTLTAIPIPSLTALMETAQSLEAPTEAAAIEITQVATTVFPALSATPHPILAPTSTPTSENEGEESQVEVALLIVAVVLLQIGLLTYTAFRSFR
jgi:hypothetical protein